MYECIGFNKTYLKDLTFINDNRLRFNLLNEDFVNYFNELNFLKRLLIYNKVKLLRENNRIQGYLWIFKNEDGNFIINSMYINGNEDIIKKYRLLLNSFKGNKFIYNCRKNFNNFEVLTEIGFKRGKGTLNMKMSLNNLNYTFPEKEVEFEALRKGKQEELRCNIQNDVFRNDDRMPLSVDDMLYDEYQSYYYEEGAVFIKYNKEYAGYGQIILIDNVPTIVNVGILKEFRLKGLGSSLMQYLLTLLIKSGYKEVNLKVSSDNSIAIKMYNKLGFEVSGETFTFEYNK
ncbi:GNAT family N-acetyltransferase [Candidatus Clostridium stratigraminis]|uniref:GNAT family N-acetyltransferase n=1 Tax=Candidatus Clostridium stratigraminis TaxID=3381661 RepID=A0ABW8T689_9CLOT